MIQWKMTIKRLLSGILKEKIYGLKKNNNKKFIWKGTLKQLKKHNVNNFVAEYRFSVTFNFETWTNVRLYFSVDF